MDAGRPTSVLPHHAVSSAMESPISDGESENGGLPIAIFRDLPKLAVLGLAEVKRRNRRTIPGTIIRVGKSAAENMAYYAWRRTAMDCLG